MRRAISAALCVLAPWIASAQAETVAQFYEGKTITCIVAAGPGGSHSLYSQFLFPHVQKHLPGHPSMIIQNEGGAGGTRAANYLYNRSPRDGTHIGIMLSDMPMGARLKLTGVKYEPKEFSYIAGAARTQSAITLLRSAGITSLKEAMEREVVLGSSGKSSQTYTIPTALNALIGTKFKVVLGYPGMAAVDKAFEQGEIQGRAGVWASLKQGKPHMIRDGQLVHIAVADVAPIPDMPGVPLVTEFVKNAEDRKVLEFIIGTGGTLGRAWLAPPEVPADRLTALREAFEKALSDPEVIAAATARNLDWDPVKWQELQAAAASVVDAKDKIVERAREAMGVDDKS
ncbi:MAG: Bug family tripartite tricarboxylate transporter substrate binding protein [Rhodospirillales bacterium]